MIMYVISDGVNVENHPFTSYYLGINNLYINVDTKQNFIITDHVTRCFTLPVQIYWEFMQHLDYIHDQLIKVMNDKEVFCKIHLGLNCFVSVKSPFSIVTFERLYIPDISTVKFYDSFRLHFDEWNALYHVISKINCLELEHFKPCYMQHGLNRFQCVVCCPK